jgi:hypothetical protein
LLLSLASAMLFGRRTQHQAGVGAQRLTNVASAAE